MVKMEGDTSAHFNLNHIFCSLTTIFYILMDKVVVHVYGQEAWMIFEENKLSRHFYPTPAAAASLAPCLLTFQKMMGGGVLMIWEMVGWKAPIAGKYNLRRQCFLKESPHIQPEFNALPLLCISDTLWLCLVNMCTWTFLHNVLLS